MGCMSTKLVPEDPPNTHLVETVYSQDTKTRNNRQDADIKTQTHLRQQDPISRKPSTDTKVSNKSQDQRTNKKVKNYQFKYNPRVNAKYDIKALIGRGSFCLVARVEHRLTRQPYAIKMFDRSEGKEVFEAELNVLRRIKHIYIIQLVEVFETPEKVYMVMELATGGDLFDRIIAKGSFTERDATRVLKMVLDGIKYLHGLGITHRDLKLENLLYYHPGHDSKIMITDFGLSAMLKGPDNHMRTICGTPEYIAPEIIAKQPYTCQVDIWAVGVITYVLLSGTMPFDDDNRARMYRMIIQAKYSYDGEHWKGVSTLAKDFIDKTMVLDPNQRLTASQASKHPWLHQSTHVASSRNLQRTISLNLLNLQSQCQSSTESSESTRSSDSNKSNRPGHSLRSDRRRVQPEDIEELHKDPEVQAELASLGSRHSSYSQLYGNNISVVR